MKLSNLLQKEYFIFDMDGTILDLENLNYNGYKETLKKFFNLTLTQEEYQIYFSGVHTSLGFTKFLEKKFISGFNVEELIRSFRDGKRYNLQNNIEEVVLLKDGVVEFFEILKDHKKSLSLATSTIKEFVDLILEHFNLSKYFELILTAEDVNKGKPDPEIYNTAVSLLCANKESCIVFEDSKSGIQSAKNAGIYCIGIYTKGLNEDFVNTADYVIEDYKDFILRD